MFGAQKKMQAQLRLISLRQKEANLLDRKASLPPGDQAAAQKLTEDINRYNAEQKSLQEEIRQHPEWNLQ
jgi:hypothetical protein